jgi:hypothetical protein
LFSLQKYEVLHRYTSSHSLGLNGGRPPGDLRELVSLQPEGISNRYYDEWHGDSHAAHDPEMMEVQR